MSKFVEYLNSYPSERVVGWPFRFLAMLLLAATLVALAGGTFLAVTRHNSQSVLRAVAFLPLAALVIRSVGFAALRGRVIHNPLWPFASGPVAFVWVVLAFLVEHYV